MLNEVLAKLNINPEELINQSVLTEQALKEINKFHQRIEERLNDPAFAEKKGALCV